MGARIELLWCLFRENLILFHNQEVSPKTFILMWSESIYVDENETEKCLVGKPQAKDWLVTILKLKLGKPFSHDPNRLEKLGKQRVMSLLGIKTESFGLAYQVLKAWCAFLNLGHRAVFSIFNTEATVKTGLGLTVWEKSFSRQQKKRFWLCLPENDGLNAGSDPWKRKL